MELTYRGRFTSSHRRPSAGGAGWRPECQCQRDADTAECGERWAETSSCGLWPLPACGRRPTGLAGQAHVSLQIDLENKRPEGGSQTADGLALEAEKQENVFTILLTPARKLNNTSGPPGPRKAGSGRRQGSYAPGPLARPPGDTVAGSTASASRASRSWLRAVAACMPCGLACSLHAAVGRTSIGTVLPDIRDGRGNRDRTALIPSVAWTSLVTNVVMTGLP